MKSLLIFKVFNDEGKDVYVLGIGNDENNVTVTYHTKQECIDSAKLHFPNWTIVDRTTL